MSYKLEYRISALGLIPQAASHPGHWGAFFILPTRLSLDCRRSLKLLDDIWESTGKALQPQPIVVKSLGGGKWELIDGQQRLTTLWLLLRFMNRASPAITWNTRPGRAARRTLKLMPRKLKRTSTTSTCTRPIQPLLAGSQTRWGCSTSNFVDEMFRFSRPRCASSGTKSRKRRAYPLFTRLNRGRIPLTDAELLKAVLLAKVQETPWPRDRDRRSVGRD